MSAREFIVTWVIPVIAGLILGTLLGDLFIAAVEASWGQPQQFGGRP